jgi:hypothetical protein
MTTVQQNARGGNWGPEVVRDEGVSSTARPCCGSRPGHLVGQALALRCESGVGPPAMLTLKQWRGYPYLMSLGARLFARPNPKLLLPHYPKPPTLLFPRLGVWSGANSIQAHPGHCQ